MEFLQISEVLDHSTEIRVAFESLMNNRRMAPKKHAAQWRYFRHCLEHTLGSPTEACNLLPLQISQYKFEIENKLRHIYLRGGQALAFTFRLVSRRDAKRGYLVDDDYPDVGGYHLLVSDVRMTESIDPNNRLAQRAQIAMVVTECIRAKFVAYQTLPVIDKTPLLRWFASDGPAYLDLIETLKLTQQRLCILTNDGNPSTQCLLAVELKELRNGRAEVKTKEYWYLKWWSTFSGKYMYLFQENNRHTYFLIQKGDKWFVEKSI